MTLSLGFARQLARPEGMAGRLLGTAMDIANRKPTRLAVDLLSPQPGETILDAGCGTGSALAQVLRQAPCRVVGVDRSATMTRQAKSRLLRQVKAGTSTVHNCDIAGLPMAPGSFDGALALNVLYFCDDGASMVADIRAHLRTGGRLVAYVTDRSTMERWPMARTGTHRLFDARQLADLLQQGGFAPGHIHIEQRQITSKVTGLFAFAEA